MTTSPACAVRRRSSSRTTARTWSGRLPKTSDSRSSASTASRSTSGSPSSRVPPPCGTTIVPTPLVPVCTPCVPGRTVRPARAHRQGRRGVREGQPTMAETVAPRVTRTYRALKGVAWIVISIFYRRIDVTGEAAWREPFRPTVVVANHTNALADPAVILAKLPGHPRFLAAGSWWKFAPARWLFKLAGVVPVYRRGDGGGAGANVATFAACHEALAEGATLAVFPEGELHHEPSIAPLKTGAARIALGAAAEAGVADVVVLPVGIVYEDRG